MDSKSQRMRRLDLRPQKRLRNPARHLRALARWPARIVDQLPTADVLAGERFWNFKLPVFSKLVEPPHATAETQRACLAAIFASAGALEHSPRRPRDCRIACLVTTPSLFQSEVTLFFDEAYFSGFLPVSDRARTDYDGGWIEASPADGATIADIVPPAPAGLDFLGGTALHEVDHAWERDVDYVNWVWAYPRR